MGNADSLYKHMDISSNYQKGGIRGARSDPLEKADGSDLPPSRGISGSGPADLIIPHPPPVCPIRKQSPCDRGFDLSDQDLIHIGVKSERFGTENLDAPLTTSDGPAAAAFRKAELLRHLLG